MMNNPAFIVDGHLERNFIQKVCPGKKVRILNCNGHAVSVKAIAKRIATHCRLFKGKYYPIIIWVDREDRDVSTTEFANELEQAISEEGIQDQIILGVADRNIENWIIADKLTVRKEAETVGKYPGVTDGYNGKSKIKQIIEGYHETTTGVELLTRCYASRMICSPSFKAFYEKLPKKGCWWLER